MAKLMRVRVEGSKKRQRHGFAAQRGQFFQRMALDFLKGFGLVQQKNDFFGAERFDAQQVAEAIWHNASSKFWPGRSSDPAAELQATRSTSMTRSS